MGDQKHQPIIPCVSPDLHSPESQEQITLRSFELLHPPHNIIVHEAVDTSAQLPSKTCTIRSHGTSTSKSVERCSVGVLGRTKIERVHTPDGDSTVVSNQMPGLLRCRLKFSPLPVHGSVRVTFYRYGINQNNKHDLLWSARLDTKSQIHRRMPLSWRGKPAFSYKGPRRVHGLAPP